MNLVQKKYLMNRIETLSKEKKVNGEKKETDERDLIYKFGEVSDFVKSKIVSLLQSENGVDYYNKIALEPKDYLDNYGKIKKMVESNVDFNSKLYEKERARNTQIDKDVASLNDKIMFGTDEECYKLLDEFANKEYKM